MSNKRSPLLVPLAVVALCAALFLLLVGLAGRNSEGGGEPQVGFPIVLVVLAVVAVVGALVWRAVSRNKSDSHH